jgi:hypothetical protein
MEHENLEEAKSSWGGSRAGAGRPKGATNKIPKQVRENIVAVFDELGGLKEMVNWAKSDPKNQTEFYRFYTRLAPMEQKVVGDPDQPLNIGFSWIK